MRTALASVLIPATLALMAGCRGGVVIVDRPAHPRPVVVEQPGVVEPAPEYVEEGAVVGGVVVAAVPDADYVYVNGGWYYWHPGLRVWVHAHRAEGWRPGAGVRVYHSWGEHPMYHRR